jgi:hypothetical protein
MKAFVAVSLLAACETGTSDSDQPTVCSDVGCDASVALPGGNLIANPSFETDLSGWSGWQSTLSRKALTGAPNGSYVVKAARATGTQYSVDDWPGAVSTAGVSYQAVAYVRSASTSARGKSAMLLVREHDQAGNKIQLNGSSSVNLSSTFQKLTVSLTAQGTGDLIDVYVVQDNAVSGDAFYADAFSLVAASSCTPTTCAAQGDNCGTIPDQCGGTLSCGTCTSPDTCGGGGVANVCGNASTSIYWGARDCNSGGTGGMPPWNMAAQTTFENTVAAGKGASLIHWGAPFTAPNGTNYAFDTSAANNVRNHGSISVYDWAPYKDGQGSNQPAYSLGSVIAGNWDAYITAWFQAVKAWGHPIFLRWAWEMNIQAWPWSEGLNGNTAGQYVQAWKHVHDLATSIGATNVTWVWCPNNSPSNNYAEFYPGDAYVDWTCLDGYNWGTDPNGHMLGWQTFDQIYHSAYQAIQAVAPTKPIMIGEVASTEYGGSKAAWITDMLGTQLPNNYPKMKAFMWFDCNYGPLWPLESSTSAEQAFANGIGSPYYDTNRFGSLSTSPIGPP